MGVTEMKKLYIISFSSFYKAAYARDKLLEEGFRASVRRLPPELVKSCGYGIYIKTEDIGEVKHILAENQIAVKSIYRADENEFVKIR